MFGFWAEVIEKKMGKLNYNSGIWYDSKKEMKRKFIQFYCVLMLAVFHRLSIYQNQFKCGLLLIFAEHKIHFGNNFLFSTYE